MRQTTKKAFMPARQGHRRPSFHGGLLQAAALLLLAAGCASRAPRPAAPPHDPDLTRLASAAHRVFLQAGPERAAPLYLQALQRARALDAPSAIRPLAFNLAGCLLETGRAPEADALLDEAREAAERAGEPIAEILLLKARAALRLNDPGATEDAIDAATRAAGRERRPELGMALTLLRVESALERDDLEAARTGLAEAERLIRPRDPLPLKAQREGVRARVLELENRTGEAAEAWELQARFLGAAGLARSVPAALERAARAYEAAGRPESAAACSYRAARSWMAQDRMEEGRAALDRAAAAAADPAVGEGLRAAIGALQAEAAARD